MGFSCRRFLLDQNDSLYRLPDSGFEQMWRDPQSARYPQFAGQRVRMVETIVELLARQPMRVVHTAFSILNFDGDGRLDPSALDRHQRARAELALAPLMTDGHRSETLVDASSRFVAQGGSWVPSRDLARRIEDAALARLEVPRLESLTRRPTPRSR